MITPDFAPYIIRWGVSPGECARPEKIGPTRGSASTIKISLPQCSRNFKNGKTNPIPCNRMKANIVQGNFCKNHCKNDSNLMVICYAMTCVILLIVGVNVILWKITTGKGWPRQIYLGRNV
ncbi:MAG: hypothetical protein CVT49_13045 [candidate division Zixibacteria bacterium HGW-Zixibacteria-1]|nr:MAG: hypothetical protein CVT49_13045 [candidate division Zixibacteria bacterium HGW-Zixibacteria-1]